MDIILSSAVIGAVIGATISSFVTLFIALSRPKIKEKFMLREIYLAPFREWCSKLYGELDEFNRRYLSKGTNCLEYPPIQIIDDYRMIHEVLKDAPIWVGKIEKECRTISDSLKELIDTVDRFWHTLEGQYNLQLKDRMDIIQIPNNYRKKIAEEICKHIEETGYPNIGSILNYLREKKIP